MSGEHPHKDLEERIVALEDQAHTHLQPGPELAKGSWVLQQIDSMGQFNNLRGQIEAAVNQPAALGFSVRAGWDRIETAPRVYDWSIFNEAHDLAQAAGKPLSVRFMGGRWTPDHVGGPTHQEDGETVPTPFNADSTVNQIWLDAYASMVDELTLWAVNRGVSLVHYAWWGALWAELHHGQGVRKAPGYGAGWQVAWLPAHEALMQVVLDRIQGVPVFAEFPLTGRGPLTSGQSEALADYLSTPQAVVQMNGWQPDKIAGGPNNQVENLWMDLATLIRDRGQLFALQDVGTSSEFGWANPTQPGEATQAYGLADTYQAAYTELYLPRWTDPEILAAAAAWVN